MKKLLSTLLFALITSCSFAMEFASIDQVRDKLKDMYENGRLTPGVITVTRTIKTVYPDGSSTSKKIPFDQQVALVENLKIRMQDLMPLLRHYIYDLHLQPLAEQIEVEHVLKKRITTFS